MDKQEVIDYWKQSAQNDREAAEGLFRLKHYSWSLFVWQLVVEKTLKALVVQSTDRSVPTTHDLVKLAKATHLNLTTEQINSLKEITGFNINARYDDYKYAFYKKANRVYTSKWIKIINEFLSWLNKQN